MVAPLIAGAVKSAAAPAIATSASGAGSGAAMRSAGGKMMHSRSAATRSKGSRMLQTKDMSQAVDRIAGHTDKSRKALDSSLKVIRKISSATAKILNTMQKASPALRQQLIVLGKGFQLAIRPIGDIMAKFLRPMAIWVMKVAMKWYSIFGTSSGKGKGTGDPTEAVQDARLKLQSLINAGAPQEVIDTARNDLASKEQTLVESESGSGQGFKDFMDKLFGDLIPESLLSMIESLKTLFEALRPVLEAIVIVLGVALLAVLTIVQYALMLLAETFKILSIVIKELWEGMKAAGTWIKETFIKAWDALLKAMNDSGAWIINKLIGAWESLSNTFEAIVNKVTGWIDKIKNAAGNIGDKVKEKAGEVKEKVKSYFNRNKAIGGAITETGQYNLHAGERVVTAGDVSRMGQASGGNGTTNNTFNINATINSDIDIRYLAERLAELQETELRRRVSYM